jgi:pimeloyl-ACP methyl ester carboxylesterase
MDEVIQAPSPTGLIGQARGLFELPKLLVQFPELARQPRGRGQRVFVLPGYGATDASTAILRGYIRFIGYRPVGWGFGRNCGVVPELLPRIVDRVDDLARRDGEPVRLIGWSLGGYLAREVARERPRAVHQVITLGSPVIGGPKYTAVAGAYRRRGIDLDAIEAEVEARNRQTLETDITAVYSQSDGVVAWRACIDRHAPNVEHVEVKTTHLGLGLSPTVFRIIAVRLAR